MRQSCRQWPIATCPSEPTMCLTLRPFLHLGQMLPARRSGQDAAPYGGTILTAPSTGTQSTPQGRPPDARRKTKMSTDNARCLTGEFAANCPPLVDWRRRLTGRGFQGLPTHTM